MFIKLIKAEKINSKGGSVIKCKEMLFVNSPALSILPLTSKGEIEVNFYYDKVGIISSINHFKMECVS